MQSINTMSKRGYSHHTTYIWPKILTCPASYILIAWYCTIDWFHADDSDMVFLRICPLSNQYIFSIVTQNFVGHLLSWKICFSRMTRVFFKYSASLSPLITIKIIVIHTLKSQFFFVVIPNFHRVMLIFFYLKL